MSIRLKRATLSDAEALHRMQVTAFLPLLRKYNDYAISPAAETLDRIREKLSQPETRYYFIMDERRAVGAIRIVDHSDPQRRKVISPLFITDIYRGKGYAGQAVREAERLHGQTRWALNTILEEPGNCRLYEKLGYHSTGSKRINDRLTIVDYEKD